MKFTLLYFYIAKARIAGIPTEQLAAATYYLQVTDAAGQALKTFQIIKRY
jgi:hypothetical protein